MSDLPDVGAQPAVGPWQAVAHALTGENLPAPLEQPLEISSIVAWLEASGWTTARLVEHRAACQLDEVPWPHQVASSDRGGLGAAQFHSIVAQVRAATGLSGLLPTRREGPPVWGADDRRLLADKPPHHLG